MNEIDDYMDKDPNEMSKADIDKIIAYHRQHRARMEAGGKRGRAKKEEGPKQELDAKFLENMIAGLEVKAPAAPVATFKRRI